MPKFAFVKALRYIKAIVPLNLPWEPYYSTADQEIAVGDRVRVRVGPRLYLGVVSEVDVTPVLDVSRILPVAFVERGLERITQEEIALWRFIADYYLCPIGDVYKCAYPALKVRSEQTAARTRERAEALEQRRCELYAKRISRLEERISRKQADLEKKHNESVTQRLTSELERIQQELDSVKRRFEEGAPAVPEEILAIRDIQLSDTEVSVYERLAGQKKKPVLLSGSGPSHVRIIARLAKELLEQGKGVLYLVPEIAMGEMIRNQLSDIFGKALMKFDSACTPTRRRRISDAVRSGEPYIIVGTRSALFLPLLNLGLVVVDEEQDASYKQNEPAPRYNARDLAVVLSSIHKCRTILVSDTPSLESEYNCATSKYDRVHAEIPYSSLADVDVIDTTAERRKNGMLGDISRKLLEVVNDNLGRPVVLLSPYGDAQELSQAFSALAPDVEASAMSLYEARRSPIPEDAIVALFNAEALVSRQDFRADEHALQTIHQLRLRCGRLVLQTKSSEHPVFSGADLTVASMLEERRCFNMPPFSRIVDVKPRKGGLPERITLPHGAALARAKKDIFEKYSGDYIIDVDPQ